jgi:2-(1,2-epoxy-1,2-dihydrophenyl)acetyl-CoA isomerase
VNAEVERTARLLYQALGAGDRQALDVVLHPDFVGHATEGLPFGMGGTHTGPEAMRRGLWGRIAAHFEARADVVEMSGLVDGGLLVRGRYRGQARESRRMLDAEFMHVLRFAEDGRILALDQLTDSAAWRCALGEGAPLETVECGIADGVATICLNRPHARNAIDQRVADDTLTAVRLVQQDRSVRAVLLCANGSDFSVGGDLHYIRAFAPEQYGDVLTRMTSPFHEAFRQLARLDAPIVAAAHGLVVGGALGYLYAADLVLAAEDTTFLTAFADVGLSGDGGGTWHLARIVGARRAAQMYLQNTPIDASTALDWGLVNEVVPSGEIRSRAVQLALQLAQGPTKAYGRMRQLLRDAWTNDLSHQLYIETALLAETAITDDAVGALDAFADKRRPKFAGC